MEMCGRSSPSILDKVKSIMFSCHIRHTILGETTAFLRVNENSKAFIPKIVIPHVIVKRQYYLLLQAGGPPAA